MGTLLKLKSALLKPAFLFFPICFVFSGMYAQTRDLDTVYITLSSRSFGQSIPFDVPFSIYGKADNIERVELRYRVKPSDEKHSLIFPLSAKSDSNRYSVEGPAEIEKIKDSIYLKINFERIKPNKRFEPKINLTAKKKALNPFTKIAFPGDTVITLLVKNNRLTSISNPKDVSIAGKYINDSWHYFPSKNETDSAGYKYCVPWIRLSDGDSVFKMTVGPLHPNVMYDFKFLVYQKTGLSTDQQNKFKAEITEILEKEFDIYKINSRTTADSAKLNAQILAVVNRMVDKRGQLTDANGNPFNINLFQRSLVLVKDSLFSSNKREFELEAALKNAEIKLLKLREGLIEGKKYDLDIKEEIMDVESGTVYNPMPAATQSIWNELISKKITIKKIAHILSDKEKLKAILTGNSKIDTTGNIVIEKTTLLIPDSTSIAYIYSFFQELSAQPFVVTKKTSSLNRYLFKTDTFTDFKWFFEQLYKAVLDKDEKLAKDIVADAIKPFRQPLLNDPGSDIKNKLSAIVHNSPDVVSGQTSNLLDKPLNPSIAEYKELKVMQAAVLVYNSFDNPDYFRGLLRGEAKIDGTGESIEATSKKSVDLPSLKILLSFFRLINSPAFTDTLNQDIFTSQKYNLSKIVFELEKLASDLEKYGAALSGAAELHNAFADILADTYIKKSYLLSGSSLIDMNVQAEKNPYVGVDIGVGFAPDIHTVFIHEGINIYFRPVNKNTPISSLYGMDRFLKTFSVFIGVTQNVTEGSANSRYEALFDGDDFKSSFLLGAGMRFNSFMRLNLAGLVYKRKDLNPLVTSSKIRITPSVTLALDVSIAKLIKSIGGLFP